MSWKASSVPLIGVPCAWQYSADGSSTPRHSVGEPYLRALTQAGAMPLLVPLVEHEERLRAAYERLDGLLLAGGGDVDPIRYGEPRHPATVNVDPRRDAVEAILVGWALADGLAILAVCRGIQMLNVAAGGSLYQDVAQRPGALKHDFYPNYPRNHRAHRIEVVPGSRLAAILAAADVPVNSLHHQGVRVAAPGFTVVARAPDGLIEGLEHLRHTRHGAETRYALAEWRPDFEPGQRSRPEQETALPLPPRGRGRSKMFK